MTPEPSLQFHAFETELGWIAVLGRAVSGGSMLERVVFGYHSKSAARAAFDARLLATAQTNNWWPSLVDRLADYAAGSWIDFCDVQLDLAHLAPFQRKVVRQCRAIPYGETRSYGELARASGSARAARAVGTTMATNCYPLIVPCHRVINSDGSIGRFGGPEGSRMKARLLEMEWRAAMGTDPPKRRERPSTRAAIHA